MKKIISNKEKNLISKLKSQYDIVGTLHHDMVKVIKGGKYGFVNQKGELVIPLIYDWATVFARIKLYGKWYIASWVRCGNYQMLINLDNKPIIQPMDAHTRYYVINDKLWIQNEHGYNLTSRRGKFLLQTDYEHIINDRWRQPKNIYLVKKQGHFGAIYIYYNNKERPVLPFEYDMCNFWWMPGTGIFIQGLLNGKNGLFNLKGQNVIPCAYDKFTYATPFRKGFVLAHDAKGVSLYDGIKPLKICTDPYAVIAEYSFYDGKQCYYTAYTSEEECLLDKEGRILMKVNKRKELSCFHYLMSQVQDEFRFKSLKELLCYCRKMKDWRVSHADKEEVIIYAYYFMEEMLQQYATRHELRYVRFGFLNRMKENDKCWGQCVCADRRIELNLSLLWRSEKFIREVMLHELVHLKYVNHHKAFYDLLGQLSGISAKQLRKAKSRASFDAYLVAMNWFAIVKRKKKELFIRAVQKGICMNPTLEKTELLLEPITNGNSNVNRIAAAQTRKPDIGGKNIGGRRL